MNLTLAKRALGLLSIAMGVAAVAAPRRVSSSLGLQADEQAISAFGAREIASGAGLLSPVKPGPWFWMRVAGDVMDLAVVGRALGRDNPKRAVVRVVAAVVAGIAIIDTILAVDALLDKRENAKAAT